MLDAERFIKECKRIIKNKYYKKDERESLDLVLCRYDGWSGRHAEFSDGCNFWYKCESATFGTSIAVQKLDRAEWVEYAVRRRKIK